MDKFRIKEVAIHKDGTNVWFYPEICIEETKTTGVLWWKKTETKENWQRFFKNTSGKEKFQNYSQEQVSDSVFFFSKAENVIGFRDKKEAEDFINKFKEEKENKEKEQMDRWFKYVGSTVKEGYKTHEVK